MKKIALILSLTFSLTSIAGVVCILDREDTMDGKENGRVGTVAKITRRAICTNKAYNRIVTVDKLTKNEEVRSRAQIIKAILDNGFQMQSEDVFYNPRVD